MKKQILACLLITAITGCYVDGVEFTDEEKIAYLEASGKLPTLDRSGDLLGPDEDDNGVRDDIDDYINYVYTQPEQHAAAMQEARSLRKYLTVDVTDDAALRKLFDESARSINCAHLRFETPSPMLRKLEAMNANTKQRLQAYLAVSKAADGMVFSLPSGDTCE